MEKEKNGNIKKKTVIYKKLPLVIAIMIFISANHFTANAYTAEKLVPVGSAIGINMDFCGAVVISVTATSGGSSPAKEAGIAAGDIITAINGEEVNSSADIKKISEKYDGSPVKIKIIRQGCEKEVTVTPYCNPNGGYELGVWLRDSMAGLGTMTFYDPETGVFGALGHGINDTESGTLMPLREGVIVDVDVSEVVEGHPGSPGQLRGTLNFDKKIGTIDQNTENGVFGKSDSDIPGCENDCLTVCHNDEIKVGEAVILCDVGEGTREYGVEISRLYLGDGFDRKNMLITVTDENLLAITGGIVQGMSGSPIIQNGKLVGAVTHVLINDPCKGYGITIENMLASMDVTIQNAA